MLTKTETILSIAYGLAMATLAGSLVLAIGFLASGSADLVETMIKLYIVGGLATALWIGGEL